MSEINILIGGINMIFNLETPHVKLTIYLSKRDKLIHVISFIDTVH